MQSCRLRQHLVRANRHDDDSRTISSTEIRDSTLLTWVCIFSYVIICNSFMLFFPATDGSALDFEVTHIQQHLASESGSLRFATSSFVQQEAGAFSDVMRRAACVCTEETTAPPCPILALRTTISSRAWALPIPNLKLRIFRPPLGRVEKTARKPSNRT
jgi:hypothetical protein